MPIDANAYRKIIGAFATGVTVVTTEVEGRLHGFTANAVTSVSLDPLLLLVCVDRGARANLELGRARAFGVNILTEAQRNLADLFAKSEDPMVGSLRGTAFRIGSTGAPLIEGALAWLECESDRALEGGDHTIYIGRVVAGVIAGEDRPLVYFRGSYRTLAR